MQFKGTKNYIATDDLKYGCKCNSVALERPFTNKR